MSVEKRSVHPTGERGSFVLWTQFVNFKTDYFCHKSLLQLDNRHPSTYIRFKISARRLSTG
jgi:hypothetical protein